MNHSLSMKVHDQQNLYTKNEDCSYFDSLVMNSTSTVDVDGGMTGQTNGGKVCLLYHSIASN